MSVGVPGVYAGRNTRAVFSKEFALNVAFNWLNSNMIKLYPAANRCMKLEDPTSVYIKIPL